jgi:hypothetical protein
VIVMPLPMMVFMDCSQLLYAASIRDEQGNPSARDPR